MDGNLFETVELEDGTLSVLTSYDSPNLYSWDFEWVDGGRDFGDRWFSTPEEAIDDFESRCTPVTEASVQPVNTSGGSVSWNFDTGSWHDPSADGVYGTPCWVVSGTVHNDYGEVTGFSFTVFDGDWPNEYFADLELDTGFAQSRQFSTDEIPATEGFERMLSKVFGDDVTP